MANIKNNVEQEVVKLIAEIAEIDADKITPEASFVEDLGMDSMMALEIMASLEKKYKIKIPESDLSKMTNLKEVMVLLKNYM